MATQIQWRRGNTAQTAAFTGAVAEITVDTDKKTVVVHDGSTVGGTALAKEGNLTAIFVQANASFDKANSANILAQQAFDKANSTTQQGFVNVSVNGTNVVADANNDTLTLSSANGVAIYANASDDSISFNLTLTGVTAGSYGNTTHVASLTTDSYGRISSVTNTTISFPVTSVAGVTGDISNTHLLNGIIAVDGAGSNLDADLLDGLQGSSYANSAYTQSAFDKANSGFDIAGLAYDKANGAAYVANTDYTTLSAVSGTYGNASVIPIVTLAANGRVSSITNASVGITSSQVSGLATSATTDTTNASNIISGTLDATRLSASGVSASGYGNNVTIPVLIVDTYGRLTSVTNTAIRSSSTSQTGIVQLEDSVTSTSTTTAATPNSVKTAYDLATGKFSSSGGTISGDVTVSGNLTIIGQQVYANTQTVLIKDNIITLNAAIDQSAAPSVNAGLEVDRGSSANVYLIWNETSDTWQYTNDGSTYFNIADAGRLDAVFSLANGTAGVANTDYTTLSAAATVYGNATFVPSVTLTANGRVSSITNTAISFPVTSVAGVTGAVSNTDLINGIIAVDGSGSGLDADLLDGLQGSSYANAAYTQAAFDKANTGASGAATFGWLTNTIIYANSTGYLSNTSNLQYFASNNTVVLAGSPLASVGDAMAMAIALG